MLVRREIGSILLAVALLATGTQALGQGKPAASAKDLVAVLELDGIGASKAQVAGLSEQLRAELLNTGLYRLVDRAQMDKVLNEQALQQTGCTSQECAVQVGKILGVRKLVTGRVTRIEDNLWQVSAILVDVETAETLQAVTVNQDGNYRQLLTTGIAELSAKLTGKNVATGALASATPTSIKIGIAGPFTGTVAKFGEQMMKGAEAAVTDLNSIGGIKGKKLELVVGDDACEPTQARSVATKLVELGVVAIVGHFCSSSTIPASMVYAENNLLVMTPASTNPWVTERKLPTVMRICGRDDQQGDVAGDFITKMKFKNVAIIHDKSNYGQGLAEAVKNRLTKNGIKERLYDGITQGEKDFISLINKMKRANIDAILFGGYHTEAGLLVRQAYDQGLKAKFVGGDALLTDEFASVVGKDQAIAGVYVTFGADPRKHPDAVAVVDRFNARGYDPEGYTLYAYAAVQSVVAALKANNASKDGKVLAAWLKNITLPTVIGPKSWDNKGDLKTPHYVVYFLQAKDGRIIYQEL